MKRIYWPNDPDAPESEEQAMRVVCAWCWTTMTENSGGDARISHGICPTCMAKELAGFKAARIASGQAPRTTEPELKLGAVSPVAKDGLARSR